MKLSNGIRGAAAGLAAAALAGLLAVPGSAQAAGAGTGATASMTFQSATVTAGTQPQVTFITSGAPAGAVVYLQEEGAGQPWHSIGRIRAISGTVRAPADQAGSYQYRIVVASGGAGTAIATSPPAALTVTGAGGGAPAAPATPAPSASAAGVGCTVCKIANNVLPWLALVVDPSSLWETITSILAAIGGVIVTLLGF